MITTLPQGKCRAARWPGNVCKRWTKAVLLASLLVAGPALALSNVQVTAFSDSPDPVASTNLLTYSITVENGGDQIANAVQVSTDIPTGTQLVSVSDSRCAQSGAQVLCNLGALKDTTSGGGSPVSYNVVLRVTAAGGSTLSSTTTISSASVDANSNNNSFTQITTVTNGADLAITPGGSNTATGGGSVAYTATVTNNGPDNADHARVRYTLPSAVSFVSASGAGWSCANASGVVTCTRSGLDAVGTLPVITINGKVTGPTSGTVTSSLTVDSTGAAADGVPDNNTAAWNTAITPGTDLAVTATVSSPQIGGSNVTFTLSPSNKGPITATNAQVSFALPAGFSAQSVTTTTGWACQLTGQNLLCKLPSYPTSNVGNIVVVATAPTSGSWNTSTSISSDTTDPVPANNTASLSGNIQPPQADLSVFKTKTPNPVAVGSNMTSNISVTNHGPNARTGPIVVVDTLATDETYVPTGSGGTNWACSGSAHVVTCTFAPDLANGASANGLTIITRADAPGTLANTAALQPSGLCATVPSQCDLNNVNDTGTVGVISTAARADLSISKTIPDPADQALASTDNSLTYLLTITNVATAVNPNSTDDATGIHVRDTLPAYSVSGTGISFAINNIPGLTCSVASAMLTCTGGALANGASGTVAVTVTRPLLDGNAWTNTATVVSDAVGDPDTSNNSSSVTSSVAPVADIQLVSKVPSQTSVQAGVNVQYVMTLQNNGPSAAAGVTLSDVFALPAGDSGFTFISAVASNGGSCSGMTANTSYTGNPALNCSWPASLAVSSPRTVTLLIRPNFMSNPASPRVFSNTATAATTTPDFTTGDKSKTANVTITPAATDLLVNVTDSPSASAGPDPLGYDPTQPNNNVIVYQLKVTNNGPSFATGVQVTNTYTPPAHAVFTFLCDKNAPGDACSADTPICNNLNQAFNNTPASITCSLPTGMTSGSSYTRYLVFQIQSTPGVGGDVYAEHAVVSRNEPDTNAGNDFADETTTVRNRADVAISKAPSLPAVSVNQPFNWTLTATNNGPGSSLQTTVADTLPANMEFVGSTPVTTTQGTCTVSGVALNCALGAVSAHASATVTAQVRQTSYPAGGVVSNTATITTTEVDSDQTNNTATSTVNVVRSSLAGTVYFDKRGNGVLDAGTDVGVANVVLKLTGGDAYGNAISLQTSTDANGNFRFDNLSPASAVGYTLSETQPGGYVSVVNAAGTAGGSVNADVISGIAVAANQNSTGYLFGETQVTGLNGSVYVDANSNNLKDAGEGGIAGVTITLTGTSNANVAVNCVTTTDASGNYVFPDPAATGACANLTPGTYTVTETQPVAFNDHGETAGSAGGNTSVPNVISNVPLTAGVQASGYLFGETGTGLSGSVYVDQNNNGVRDSGEAAIKNVTITLDGTDALGHAVHQTTSTDANGQYAFLNVPGANAAGYTITETQPTTWGEGQTTAGTLGGTPAPDVISAVHLGANQYGSNYNFGEIGGTLAGRVYLDVNNNGVMDANEAPMPGVVVTLSGVSDDGTPVNATATADANGQYSFSNLPHPNVAGYTLSETQPVNYGDGKSSAGSVGGASGVNTITSVVLPAGAHGTAYNFGDTVAATATVSGKVWIDYDHDRDETTARNGSGQPGWSVQLSHNGKLVNTALTDAQGGYVFNNVLPSIVPGDDYSLVFVSPKGYVYGTPVSPDPAGQVDFSQHSAPRSQREQSGEITGLYLASGANVPLQSLPLDPSGMVYDSVRRVPVAGASVRLQGPAGFDAATQLVGGTSNLTQVTDASGIYTFLLLPTAPAGTYTLVVTSPAGYTPGASSMIPSCANVLNVLGLPKPALVQANESAPLLSATTHNPQACPATSAGLVNGAGSTQYYLNFNFTPGVSANLVNNHIPVDPILSGALVVRKTTPSGNVQIGDLVPYTITAQNTLAARLVDVDLRDQLPPGFKYRSGSASIDGVRVEPTVLGRGLTWKNQTFEVGQTHTYKLMLIVGTGVNEGEYVNQAWALNNIVNTQISNVGTATVRVVPDPLFDCPDIIGKVFDDQNANGYQDDGEPGIPAVRLVTPRGLVVTTDAQGRFHVPCPDIPDQDIGTNFVMKLDERTLPSGFRLTSENPRDVRLTRGKMVKLNFGATIHRVVRVELTDAAFVADTTELAPAFKQSWQDLVAQLQPHPSVLRLAYRHASAPAALVKRRLDALHQDIDTRWHALKNVYPLQIEEEQLEVAQ